MTGFVLDASMALSWCFRDEATGATQEVLRQAIASGFSVPSLWLSETANALLVGSRRGRMTEAAFAGAMTTLRGLTYIVDTPDAGMIFGRVITLAQQEKLTAYDATYLELALRLGVPLASLDRDLRNAAHRRGVALLAA